ncbi:MAG: carboxypeptidase regulatory-like domain-containing protein [Planctomycetes bacterium]|nr:carboxypeptidase regulatory-like domain-containing protein [Planctomycetota bacterium]
MNKHNELRDKLLQADGIDPSQVSNSELTCFRQLLDKMEPERTTWKRIRIISQRITKPAIAAAILMAVLTVIYFRGDSIDGTNSAWAKALEETRNANSFTCRVRITQTTDVPEEGKIVAKEGEIFWYFSEQHGGLMECFVDGKLSSKTYLLFDSNESVLIKPTTKEYEPRPLKQTRDDIVENVNPKQLVIRTLEGHYVELGQKTINGQVLIGIESRDSKAIYGASISRSFEEFVLQIWFDKDTKLPVHIDLVSKPKEADWKRRSISDQFDWGVEFPVNLFEPNIPGDYTLKEYKRSEFDALKGLRLFSDLSNGKYPSRLDDETVIKELGDYEKALNTMKVRQELKGEYRLDMIFDACHFYSQLIDEGKRVGYHGDKVTVKDWGSILMYWSNSASDYRVMEVFLETLRIEKFSAVQLGQRLFETQGVASLSTFQEADKFETELAMQNKLPVTIRVVDEQIKRPMEFVRVEVVPKASESSQIKRVHTDRLGQCNFPLLLGDYEVTAVGWENGRPINYSTTLSVAPGHKNPSVELAIPTIPLVKGRLVYANGKSVRRGTIRIGENKQITYLNGHFIMAAPHGDPLDFQLGYAFDARRHTGQMFFWRTADQTGDLVLVLDWLATIRGRVIDQKGSPQSEANLGLYAYSKEISGQVRKLWRQKRTNTEGVFVFNGVPVGVQMELVVNNTDVPESKTHIDIGELSPDQRYHTGDIVWPKSYDK